MDSEGFGLGSDNHYGLFINKNLQSGTTHFSKTYLNDPLCSENHF